MALIYGSALDQALNALLLNIEDPYKVFEKHMTFAEVNKRGQLESVPEHTRLVYAEKDLQQKLLDEKDFANIRIKANQLDIPYRDSFVAEFLHKKAAKGLSNLPENEIKLYNYINWKCLLKKGNVTLDSYIKEVKPLIKNVLSVQEKIESVNQDGDTLLGFADLVLEMNDGKRVLFDHKTSSFEYSPDSASHSSQLTLYYHFLKEKYNLTHVGYIVMLKRMKDVAKKTCTSCGHSITSRAKTCDNMLDGLRCAGEISEGTDFVCPIQVITAEVNPNTAQLVIDSFDGTNKLIKSEDFSPNLESCVSFGGLVCDYYQVCHKNNYRDIEEV